MRSRMLKSVMGRKGRGRDQTAAAAAVATTATHAAVSYLETMDGVLLLCNYPQTESECDDDYDQSLRSVPWE